MQVGPFLDGMQPRMWAVVLGAEPLYVLNSSTPDIFGLSNTP